MLMMSIQSALNQSLRNVFPFNKSSQTVEANGGPAMSTTGSGSQVGEEDSPQSTPAGAL